MSSDFFENRSVISKAFKILLLNCLKGEKLLLTSGRWKKQSWVVQWMCWQIGSCLICLQSNWKLCKGNFVLSNVTDCYTHSLNSWWFWISLFSSITFTCSLLLFLGLEILDILIIKHFKCPFNRTKNEKITVSTAIMTGNMIANWVSCIQKNKLCCQGFEKRI